MRYHKKLTPATPELFSATPWQALFGRPT